LAASSSFFVIVCFVVVRATRTVGCFGVVVAGGGVAGCVEGDVDTGGDGAGAGDGVGDVPLGGGVGCSPVGGGSDVTGGAEGCGSGAVDGGCSTGDGCVTVGVRGSSELSLPVRPEETAVVVIRPAGSALGLGVIA
jgi:hypothetical protein